MDQEIAPAQSTVWLKTFAPCLLNRLGHGAEARQVISGPKRQA
jgi:hypothetical protein